MFRAAALAMLAGSALALASCGASPGGLSRIAAGPGGLRLITRVAPAAPPTAAPTAAPTAPAAEATPEPAAVAPAPIPAPRSTAALAQAIDELAAQYGAQVGVALVEVGGEQPMSWSTNGNQQFTAASTYKLPLLMMASQRIAAGSLNRGQEVCYDDSEYEDGWFDDYAAGTCLTVSELAMRAGHYSDNTAAHMLVEELGGVDQLSAYARAHGAVNSEFFDPNLTTANDLAALLANEAGGQAGGQAAQGWLYPILTRTAFEEGIPAGVGSGVTVVHKIGDIDSTLNDAALVTGAPHGDYILVVMSDGPGIDQGWPLIAGISRAVWKFEAART